MFAVMVVPGAAAVGTPRVTLTSARLAALITAWAVLLFGLLSAVVVLTAPVEVTLAPVPTTKLKV